MERKEAKKGRALRVLSQSAFVFDRARYGETNNLPSETLPSEAMTIRQIFDRFRKGLPLGAPERSGGYLVQGEDADFDSPDVDKLRESDFVERDEFQERLMNEIAQKQKQLKQRRQEETQRRQQEEKEINDLREELRARRTSKKDADSPGGAPSEKSVV